MKLHEILAALEEALSKDEIAQFMNSNRIGNPMAAVRVNDFSLVGGRVAMQRDTVAAQGNGEPLKMQCKFAGLKTFKIVNRSIESWDDVPQPNEIGTLQLVNCVNIPSLADIPDYRRIEISLSEKVKMDITPLAGKPYAEVNLKTPELHVIVTITPANAICEIYNGQKAEKHGEVSDAFELQEWLIDNGLDFLA